MPRLKTSSSARPWVTPRKAQEGRNNSNQEIYQSYRWRKLSAAKRKSSPLCEECISEGRKNPNRSEVTDHIVAINDGGDPWAWNNLQALCNMHHNSKSGKERHQ